MALTALSREQVLRHFAKSKILRDYEIGRCDDDAFAAEMIRIFSLKMDAKTLKHEWQHWVGRTYYGVKPALNNLRKTYTVACLSNTNALHWAHLKTHIDIEAHFDHAFASHLIHAAKPSPESYAIPLIHMGVGAKDVWFFDDTQINVTAAQEAGLTAFLIDHDIGVVPTLMEMGLLSA